MNASASALPREDEVQSKIRKVRTFGRTARVVCAAIFGFGLVGSVVMLLVVVLGPIPGSNSNNRSAAAFYDRLDRPCSPRCSSRCAMFLALGVVAGVWLAAVYQLYRLFGNLAAGAIYTPENVRRVRYVGLLWLLLAVLGIVIPAALARRARFYRRVGPMSISIVLFPSLSQLVGDFVSAGLILLASWIMDVGLYEKDHADALQRDADLVI